MNGLYVNTTINETVTVGLIRGRHEIPVDSYIFDDAISDVMDFKAICQHICKFIVDKVGIATCAGTGINQHDYTDIEVMCGQRRLVVYVTGLTTVTAELIKICAMNGIHLTLMHYNTATEEYIPQPIFF